MSELAKRAITGVIYVLLTLGAAWAGPVTTTLLFLPVCLLAVAELLRLAHPEGHSGPDGFLQITGAAVYLAFALPVVVPRITPMFAVAVLFSVIMLAVVKLLLEGGEAALRRTGTALLVYFLVAIPFGVAPSLLREGPELFIGFMVMLWTNDTGAYLVGRVLGRTKLLPQVSPNKTVEGLIGGIGLAMAGGWLLARAWPVLSPGQWIGCAVVVAVTSTLGDLLESAFKRNAGVKDSGTLLPGHGGILDRFDGFLLAMPAMVIAVNLMR